LCVIGGGKRIATSKMPIRTVRQASDVTLLRGRADTMQIVGDCAQTVLQKI
jgi:hypothetical protein